MSNLFDLVRGTHTARKAIYRDAYDLKDEIKEWFAEQRIPYTVRIFISGFGVLHVHDSKDAMLFKLTWM
jgi:hypothetical protein